MKPKSFISMFTLSVGVLSVLAFLTLHLAPVEAQKNEPKDTGVVVSNNTAKLKRGFEARKEGAVFRIFRRDTASQPPRGSSAVQCSCKSTNGTCDVVQSGDVLKCAAKEGCRKCEMIVTTPAG